MVCLRGVVFTFHSFAIKYDFMFAFQLDQIIGL